MPPPARCSNHRCVYIDQCEYIIQLKPLFWSLNLVTQLLFQEIIILTSYQRQLQ